MKKISILFTLVALFSSFSAYAANNKNTNQAQTNQTASAAGFAGPVQGAQVTVSQLPTLGEDDYITLQGQLTAKINPETYTFADSTGSITVVISNKLFTDLNKALTPSDSVQLVGMVGKDAQGNTIVKVKTMQLGSAQGAAPAKK